MGYDKEVSCIAVARELDLLTSPYVFNIDESKLMTEAGADIIVAHMGLTTGGSIGAETAKTLDQAVEEIEAIIETCKGINKEVLVLCHGGPIAEPGDVQYIVDKVPSLDGFYGASSMERLPTERALTEQVVNFCEIKRGK
jgi:predicted TIM-barrel enzyme